MHRLARRWRTFRQLRWRDRVAVVRLAVLLTLMRLVLQLWPTHLVQAALRQLPARRRSTPPEPSRLAQLVHLSTRVLPWRANCLHRSLVLWWLLDRRGVPAELRLGVRRLPGVAVPDFHAWVELDGQIINDRPDVRELYSTFERAASSRAVS